MKNNYTRFLVLQREKEAQLVENADKASVNFHTDHSRGSLVKVLSLIAEGGINLSKLQSMPIPGTDFRYSFHADMEFDSLEQFERVSESVRKVTESFTVLGIYKKGVIRN
jgi:prephenate dehydratase